MIAYVRGLFLLVEKLFFFTRRGLSHVCVQSDSFSSFIVVNYTPLVTRYFKNDDQ